jgi:Tfp pilus assembly protein PilF
MITDEHGNILPHGHEHAHDHHHEHHHDHHEHHHDHHHEHSHEHGHCHENCGSCTSNCDPKKEAQALLTYMLQHNEHHALELDQMAANLMKLGLDDSAKQIHEAVSDFQKGNMRLSLALTLMKNQMQ